MPTRDKVDDPALASFFALIHNIDKNFARLDAWLADRGIRDNTLLVFLNDNGTSKGESVFNAGMRGKKGSAYDGGHRAICFIRWPGGNLGEPRSIGYASHVTDILPTLADLLGLDSPDSADLDGASLKQILTGAAPDGPNRKIVVQYGGRIRPAKYSQSSVIWNDWRLVGDSELYDLSTDPGQEANVAEQHPDIVEAMQAHYEEYWAAIEPSIEEVEPLLVRADPEGFTDLTSNSWIEVDCDNRTRVAQACGPGQGGVWQIEAEESGSYSVELSRWPFHMDRSLTLEGPPTTIGGTEISVGRALPIAAALLRVDRTEPVKAPAQADAASVEFEISLKRGRSLFQGWFQDRSSRDLAGAYFGRIRRK